jgi:hypothetical protein
LDCHSGQAGDSFSLRLIRPLAEARPGIQDFQKVLDAGFHGMTAKHRSRSKEAL